MDPFAPLRADAPSPAARARLADALRTRPARSWRPAALALGTAALLAAVLWPTPSRGLAWSQVAANSLQVKRVTTDWIVKRRGSQNRTRTWEDGVREATLWEFDGMLSRRFVLTESHGYQAAGYGRRSPNGWTAGWRWKRRPEPGYARERDALRPTASVADLLQREDVREVAPAVVEGESVRYRLGYRFLDETIRYDVIADRARGLVRRVEFLSRDGKRRSTMRVDYPDRIPDEAFAIPPDALDLDAAIADASKRAGEGIARSGRIVLRAALVDDSGTLWCLWSGDLPPGTLPRLVQVAGMKTTLYPHGRRELTRTGARPSSRGFTLGGMAVVPSARLGERITLRVPVGARDWAEFRGVRPRRVDSIYGVLHELGVMGGK